MWTRNLIPILALCLPLAGLHAQGTLEDYQRAERFLAASLKRVVSEGQVSPNWIESGSQFWYLNETPAGKDFVLYDATRGTRQPAFDQNKLAVALSKAAGKAYQPRELPFDSFQFVEGRSAIEFNLERTRWTCNLTTEECKTVGEADPSDGPGQRRQESREPRANATSPDGKLTAMVKSHNLYVRVVATAEEIQLSRDGEKFSDYATPLPSPALMV